MRGASALARLLADAPRANVAVFVVWEPVLRSDAAGPPKQLTDELSDPRVRRYWDPRLLLSRALREARRDPDHCLARDEDNPVWDEVFYYPAGARWDTAPPRSDWCDGTVIRVIDQLRARLTTGRQ